MITPTGADWFSYEVQMHSIHDLALLWSVSGAKAEMIQIGIDTPTQAQVRLLHGQARGIALPIWRSVWESEPREKVLPGWEQDMKAVIKRAHPKLGEQARDKIWKRIDARIPATISSMKRRSEAKNLPCDITANQLRQMFLDSYGKPCPYLGVPMILHSKASKGIATDHIIPVADGGPSTRENLQLISARANRMKEDMADSCFKSLLVLCAGMDARSRRSVFRRLAQGSSSIYKEKKIAREQIRREG